MCKEELTKTFKNYIGFNLKIFGDEIIILSYYSKPKFKMIINGQLADIYDININT